MEFYYYKNGRRNGPIDTAALKELAQNGTIAPDVPVEYDGKIYPARKVKGLEFQKETPELPPVQTAEPAAEETGSPAEPAGANGERIIFIQQPAPQQPQAPNRAPAPYPVRVVREPRSYVQRQRAERLERTSHSLAAWGWLFLILGLLAEIIGVGFFIYEFVTESPVNEEAFDNLLGISVGIFLCAGGIHPLLFAEIMFFFSALGYKIAADD